MLNKQINDGKINNFNFLVSDVGCKFISLVSRDNYSMRVRGQLDDEPEVDFLKTWPTFSHQV